MFQLSQGLISRFTFRRVYCSRNPVQVDLKVINAPSYSVSVCSANPRGRNVWDSLNDTALAMSELEGSLGLSHHPPYVTTHGKVMSHRQFTQPAPDFLALSDQPNCFRSLPNDYLQPGYRHIRIIQLGLRISREGQGIHILKHPPGNTYAY